MTTWARRVAIVWLAVGAAGALALATWIAQTGDTPGDGAIDRGLWLLGHGRLRAPAVAGAAFAAVVAGALAWLARRRAWPLVAAACASPVAIVAVWLARAAIVRMEDPRFRQRSPYVRGATDVAIVATIYLALVGATALAAAIAARRQPPAA